MKRKSLLKRSLAVLLAAAMAVMGGACGSSTSTTSSEPAAESAASTEEAASTDAAAAETEAGTEAAQSDLYGDEVTINVMVWDRGNAAPGTTTEDNNLTQWIKDQVKELYNINVEYTAVPRSESDDKVNIMLSGGTAPDIIMTYDQALFYNYASSGALKDLTDLYAQYGGDIEANCTEAEPAGVIDGVRYAVMKQRGTEEPRHTAYIRQDWLDELGMEIPTTKAELEEYLYAVKENNLGGDNTIPWAMSGRTDTEKMYLNFVGSYVDLASDRDAYMYAESYMAVAPGSEEGLRKLNQWYNDGLISADFPTDSAEDVYKAAIANGNAGFVLDDVYNPHASFEVLNNTLGTQDVFVPVQCFDLPDGSYRNPFEYRYAMYVMIPSTTSDEKAAACMKYLNWMSDPEVAMNIYYTPDYTTNDLGVAVAPSTTELQELGYPGTPDDLSIVNQNYSWVNDYEVMAATSYENRTSDWVTEEWYQNLYEVKESGKYRFPTYAYISPDEQTYGADIKTRMVEFVYNCICCPADQFDSTYESGYQELVNAGLQKILDARGAYYDSVNG